MDYGIYSKSKIYYNYSNRAYNAQYPNDNYFKGSAVKPRVLVMHKALRCILGMGSSKNHDDSNNYYHMDIITISVSAT